MDNVVYWLWLQKSLGFGADINDLVRFYGGAKEIYEAGEKSWRSSGFFGQSIFEIKPAKIENMKTTLLSDCEKTVEICAKYGIDIIAPESELYPANLKRIKDYPAVLFAKGDLSCLKGHLPIAVIGTRKPSVYGVSAAEKISRALAKENAVIISGGALGIDSIAHRSAVIEHSKTVLVMGCGHEVKYLEENEDLRRSVIENGAVITEYPPFVKATSYSFPKRNRIISGISKGVVIIEAGESSGTLNTAAHAKKQGRDVFAVPGDISSVAYRGSNKLITQGATAVFSALDILNFYCYSLGAMNEIENSEPNIPFDEINKFDYGVKCARKKKKLAKRLKVEDTASGVGINIEENKKIIKINDESVSDNAKLVYNHMSDEEILLDDITRICGLPVRKVLISLTELEMAGAVKSCGAGRYCKV